MVVPFIALAVVLALILYFMIGAAKRKTEGKDLGDRRAGSGMMSNQ